MRPGGEVFEDLQALLGQLALPTVAQGQPPRGKIKRAGRQLQWIQGRAGQVAGLLGV